LPVRRALVAVLAVPVLATVYLSVALRRGPATRLVLALGVGGLVVAAAAGVPAGTIGAPSAAQTPLAASALGPAVSTGRSLTAALLVDFDAPMDAASVAAAVTVEPASQVRLAWSADGRRLAVEPANLWRPATLYTVTVGTGASDRDGRALASPLRAGFLTRAATTATLAVVDRLPSGVALDSSIVISFDRPVPIAGVLRALQVSPAVPGELLVATDGPEGSDPSLADNFVWQPSELFAANTRYTFSLAGSLVDADGAAVAVPDPLSFTTTTAPSVVRFRPRSGTEDVARDVAVSVRFTAPMERASTEDAFRVEVNGTTVAGTVEFAEDDTVLVFQPKAEFPYGATVVMHVGGGALGVDGAPLDRPRAVEFTVVARPEPASPAPSPAPGGGGNPKPTPKPAPVPRPASGSWAAAERYLLTLLNCTRGGGWVLSDGSCSSPGGSGVAPLKLDSGIGDDVARPYAKKLALSGVCSHFSGGDPGDRLRAAGYTGYHWAENIGCRYFSDPRDAAVSLVQFFQSERTWSPPGGHWVNMMNADYDRAGIGLWVSGGNLRFVIDFYRP
jgi:hypothetical protein